MAAGWGWVGEWGGSGGITVVGRAPCKFSGEFRMGHSGIIQYTPWLINELLAELNISTVVKWWASNQKTNSKFGRKNLKGSY